MENTMTIGQVLKACKKNYYILLRDDSGLHGVNCRIVLHSKKNTSEIKQKSSGYIGYRPCNLNEYITHKYKIM